MSPVTRPRKRRSWSRPRPRRAPRGRRRGPRPWPASCAARGRRRWAGRGTASASGTARRSRPGSGPEALPTSASRSCAAFLKVTVPAKLRWAPRSRQARAKAASPEKQCITQRSGAPSSSMTRSTSSWASRSWIISTLSRRLARSMCRRKRLHLGGPALLAGAEVVESGLADDPHPVACSRPAARSRPARRRARRPRPAAAPRWGAARPRRPGRRATSAASTAHRAPGRSQPIWTMRVTRTAAAAAIASSVVSHSSPSAMSRWQWLSATGCGSGSGRAAGCGRAGCRTSPRSPRGGGWAATALHRCCPRTAS